MIRLFLCLFLLSTSLSYAQSSFGGYPMSIKWHQINTPTVRVIFPDSLEDEAQRVANIIHYMNDQNVGLLGNKREKSDIILRNHDVISNGYAQVAPYKSEFFMQAPQNTFEESSVDWMDQLALHEYRHLNQFTNARRGIGTLIYWLFGDYGWGAMIGLSMPAWFLEGDATIMETALSGGGRGRIPSFSAEQRAQQEAGVQYSYMKAMNGSFKDFVPNHYNTGYAILSEIRKEATNQDFDEITRRSSRLQGIFYPFRRAVRKVTGNSIKQHYFNSTQNFRTDLPSTTSSSRAITEMKKNNVVQFNNPIINNGEIYFSYGDRRDIRGIYRYHEDGDHELITYQGLVLDPYFDKHEHLFVWEELQRDIRRGNQNFSNLILYDEKSKSKRIIGRGQAFRSPSFSRDGKSLIFVNGHLGTESGIAMYHLETNAMVEIINSTAKQFLYPIASQDGKSIYSIVKEGHYYALAEVSLSGEYKQLTDWNDVIFGPLKLSEGHLIFQANVGVTDQIHAYDLKSGQLKQVSNDNIGMYNPSNYEGGKIIAERPHSQGFLLHEITTSPAEWTTVKSRSKVELPFYLQTEHLEPNNILDQVPSNTFPVSKYPRAAKIFKPHSWLLSSDGTDLSATLFSNNILNDVSFEPTYSYNFAVRGSFLDLSVNYGRWFPIYQLSYNYALPRIVVIDNGDRSFYVSQHSLSPGVIVPLNLTKGTYVTNVRLAAAVSQVWSNIEEIPTEETFNQMGTTLTNTLSFASRRLTARQNIFPRWGYSGLLRNRYRFNDKHNAVNLSNDFYVPGFARNHGFRFEIDFAQKNDADDTRVDHVDVFNYAHGFRSVEFDQIWSFNTNYGLPLLYPDWGFADFIYFKRVTSTLFHNYNSIMFEDQRSDLQSMGADLNFDLVFANNIFSEITVGFRNAYMIGQLPEGKKYPYHFEFLIDIPAF